MRIPIGDGRDAGFPDVGEGTEDGPVRVVWLSHIIPHPPVSGLLQRSFNLLRQAARRHDLHLLALNQHRIHADEEQAARSRRSLADLCESVRVFDPDVRASRTSVAWWSMTAKSFFSRMPYDVNWMRSPSLRSYLESSDDVTETHLLHVDTIGLFPYTAHFPAASVILNHHNVESHMMARRADLERNPAKKIYFRREQAKLARYERQVCPQVATNLVVSELEGERLRSVAPGSEVDVVENGVDTDYFSPLTPPGSGSEGLVFVGGMGWYPNREAVEYLISDIWPALQADDPNRTLTVVGRDPPDSLTKRASEDSRVRVPGFVDDVRPYVDRAMAYICPIRNGGGTRLKILDALSMGKPLVATGFAVEGLSLQEGRHFLKAETPEEYVRQIGRLEQDPDLRKSLGTQGRDFVESRYSWAVIGRRMEKAYLRSARPSVDPAHLEKTS